MGGREAVRKGTESEQDVVSQVMGRKGLDRFKGCF